MKASSRIAVIPKESMWEKMDNLVLRFNPVNLGKVQIENSTKKNNRTWN